MNQQYSASVMEQQSYNNYNKPPIYEYNQSHSNQGQNSKNYENQFNYNNFKSQENKDNFQNDPKQNYQKNQRSNYFRDQAQHLISGQFTKFEDNNNYQQRKQWNTPQKVEYNSYNISANKYQDNNVIGQSKNNNEQEMEFKRYLNKDSRSSNRPSSRQQIGQQVLGQQPQDYSQQKEQVQKKMFHPSYESSSKEEKQLSRVINNIQQQKHFDAFDQDYEPFSKDSNKMRLETEKEQKNKQVVEGNNEMQQIKQVLSDFYTVKRRIQGLRQQKIPQQEYSNKYKDILEKRSYAQLDITRKERLAKLLAQDNLLK